MAAVLSRAAVPLAWLVALGLLLLVGLRVTGIERGKLLALLLGALPLTLLPSYGVGVVALLLRRPLLGMVAAGLMATHLLVVAPALGVERVPAAAYLAPTLRVVTANILKTNPDSVRVGAALAALRPDVLVVAELRPANLPGLRASGLLDDLPYTSMDSGPLRDVELFSRLPLSDIGHREAAGSPQPRATIEVGGVAVRLAGEHPLPPIGTWEAGWRASLADLATEAGAQPLPLVVAGDFNATRDHAPFRQVLATGLRDAADARGRGLARTWPQWLPILALDHVLVRDGAGARLFVLDQSEVTLPGSDHKAVLADLAVLPDGR